MKKETPKNQELAKKIKELEDGWKRCQADFENYRKRSESERQGHLNFMKADFMTKIAPVLDNFRRASEHLSDEYIKDPVIEGFLQVQKQLEDILTSQGLEKIPTGGEIFNPSIHEAISYEESALPAETIIGEVESGWAFDDHIIKPAKVRVSKGK